MEAAPCPVQAWCEQRGCHCPLWAEKRVGWAPAPRGVGAAPGRLPAPGGAAGGGHGLGGHRSTRGTRARGAVPQAQGVTGAEVQRGQVAPLRCCPWGWGSTWHWAGAAACSQGTTSSRDGRDTLVPLGAPQCQAPALGLPVVASLERWGQSQCRVVTALSTSLCCLLGQAVGTDADDASTDIASSVEEEVAHSTTTQHVSWDGEALGREAVEPGVVLCPVTLCLCSSRTAPGPLRRAGALRRHHRGAQRRPCQSGGCGQKRSCGS